MCRLDAQIIFYKKEEVIYFVYFCNFAYHDQILKLVWLKWLLQIYACDAVVIVGFSSSF